MHTNRREAVLFFGLSASAAIAGCAGAPPSASASPSPREEANIPSGASGFAQVEAELGARRATALAEVGEARRALGVGDSDCADSCAGVMTLRTAVERLCSIRESGDDEGRCKEARVQLATTNTKINATCDGCRPPAPDDGGP